MHNKMIMYENTTKYYLKKYYHNGQGDRWCELQ